MAVYGPGLALAATGVGAGDVTTTGLGAARMGLGLLWVPVLAAVLKYFLNEGMARHQLVTGRPFIHVWATDFGPLIKYGFFIYFLGWLIPVFATSITASGVAMNLLVPLEEMDSWFVDPVFAEGPRRADVIWSLILEIIVIVLVWTGGYRLFESTMALCVAVMAFTAIGGACAVFQSTHLNVTHFAPTGGHQIGLCLGMMAGVGGTVVMLAYGSWIEDRGRDSVGDMQATRRDLLVSYLFTGGFGVCMMLLVGGASQNTWGTVLGHAPQHAKLGLRDSFAVIGYRLEFESVLPTGFGKAGRIAFGVGLIATVLSSLLGMLQSMPRLLIDYFCAVRGFDDTRRKQWSNEQGWPYRITILSCAILPCAWVCVRQPAQIVVAYAIYASLFLPFMAASLLWLNNQSTQLREYRNSLLANIVLSTCLVIFALAAMFSIWQPIT